MNLERLMNMVIKMFVRRAVNKGFDVASDYATRRGKPKEEMTADERNQAQNGKQLAKRAKDIAKISRRL